MEKIDGPRIELRPSTTAMISSAMRWANCAGPLPREGFLLAASMIHIVAVRRRCRRASGVGICRAMPPPAAPRRERIRKSGATESMATVRYRIGSNGRRSAGGEPVMSGRDGLVAGAGEARRWLSTRDMF